MDQITSSIESLLARLSGKPRFPLLARRLHFLSLISVLMPSLGPGLDVELSNGRAFLLDSQMN